MGRLSVIAKSTPGHAGTVAGASEEQMASITRGLLYQRV
jgi:hypothetical protein